LIHILINFVKCILKLKKKIKTIFCVLLNKVNFLLHILFLVTVKWPCHNKSLKKQKCKDWNDIVKRRRERKRTASFYKRSLEIHFARNQREERRKTERARFAAMEELIVAVLSMLLVVALIPLYLWKRRQDSQPPTHHDEPPQVCTFFQLHHSSLISSLKP